MEEKRALAEDYEQKLKEKHGDKFPNFQFKFGQKCWLMISTKVWRSHQVVQCSDMRVKGARKDRVVQQMTVIGGMLSVMNTLCSAITPNQSKQEVRRATLSPMKRAEMQSTYIKQLSELRSLHESAVLSAGEYEEQRKVKDLMRQLKENNM